MQLNNTIFSQMMRQAKNSLEAASTTEIIFKEGTTVLCRVPYESISVQVYGISAIGLFKNVNDGDLLSSLTVAAGIVDSFDIYGLKYDNGGSLVGSDELIISGTVGHIGSNSDIEFTRTEWTDQMIVRISKMRLIIQ